MTEPEGDDPPVIERPSNADAPAPALPRRRLRAIPAFAVASMLVAGGLLMAVSGMVRLVGPVAPTPTPGVTPTTVPSETPYPVPSTRPLGPTASPQGAIPPRQGPV